MNNEPKNKLSVNVITRSKGNGAEIVIKDRKNKTSITRHVREQPDGTFVDRSGKQWSL